MVTESQKVEVISYLYYRRIPINLLMEIQDHFISQIEYLQKNENILFEQAFLKVKETWKKETIVYKNYNGGKFDISKMSVKTFSDKCNMLFVKSFSLAILPILLFYILAKNLSVEIFKYTCYYVFVVFAIVPLLIFLINRSDFGLIKIFNKTLLNIHQLGTKILFIPFLLFNQILMINGSSFMEIIYKQMHGNHTNIWLVISGLFTIYGGFAFYFYGILSQLLFLKELKKTKPFLKYFTY